MAENMVEEDVHPKHKGRRKMMCGDKTVTRGYSNPVFLHILLE